MAKKGRELAAKGFDVINLSFGEPDFDTPEHIRQAAKQAIDEGYSHYPPVAGYPELRQAIADKFLRENHLPYKPENVVVSTGAKQSIANVVLCLVNPGDEVLIIGPYWVSYLEMVKLAEGTPIVLNCQPEDNYHINPKALTDAITERTKLIMFSSPSNPTGGVLNQADMELLAQAVLARPNLYVMADEIYEHINYVGKHLSIASLPGMFERTITVNGLSKAFAMTGWRIGYIGAPVAIAKACEKMQGQFTSGANTIAQRAAIVALNSPLESTQAMVAQFKQRRAACLAALRKIPNLQVHEPEGAFYLFPDVSAYFAMHTPDGKLAQTGEDICNYLLESQYVSLVPGEAFGEPRCIRISYAAADDILVTAMQRIAKGLAALV